MWKAISMFSLAVLVLAPEARAEKGVRRGRSSLIFAQKTEEDQVSSFSSSFALPYITSSVELNPRQLKKEKGEDDGNVQVFIPVDNPGQTEGDNNNNNSNQNNNMDTTQQGQQQQQGENARFDDSTLQQICSSANGDDSPMTTENNLSVKYEYRMFTDQVGDENTVLSLGNKVNSQIAQYLRQIYIVDFCNDYLAGVGATRARGLSPGDVRAVVPGDTELLGTDNCESQPEVGGGAPCVRMQSSVAVHFAPDYSFASPEAVGATILSDVSTAFTSGIILGAGPDVAGAAYTTGSLGTVGYEPPQNVDNNSEGDSGSNGNTTDRGNIEGTEQGAANADDNATIVVKDKMSRTGKFFLTVFILALIGGLIYAWVRLRRVEKSHSFEDENSARGDGSGTKIGATVDWFKHRLNKSRGEDDERDAAKIGMAETDDDDEGTMEVEFRNDRSQTSNSRAQSKPKLKDRARSWLAAVKNGIFDSERAETIPRTPQKGRSTSMNESKSQGFSVYGKEDNSGIASNLSYNSSGDLAGHLSKLFATSTMDTSMADQGDGTEVVLSQLEEQEEEEESPKKKNKSKRFTPSSLPSNEERDWSDSKKEEIDNNNTSTWSYDEKNFSLSDIQILVDDASTDAGSMQYSRRTYYMPDTVQL